eukprot:2418640-Amphidinium_carterae.1
MGRKIKAYLSIHNVNIEDIMDDSSRSVTAISAANIQTVRADDTRRLNGRFPVAPQEDADNYDKYVDLTMEIRKKKDDIVNYNQTRPASKQLLHSTKPGSEAHLIARRMMRQLNGFKSWRQLQLH